MQKWIYVIILLTGYSIRSYTQETINLNIPVEQRGCVKTLAQPLLYFTVLLYFLLAMLLFPHAFGNKLLYSNYIGL